MNSDNGILDLIGGNMFSSKTTNLLGNLFNFAEIGMKCLYVNHVLDDRTDTDFSTHNHLYKDKPNHKSVDFRSVSSLSEIKKIYEYDVIGIDEGQFFKDLYEEVKFLVDVLKKHVIVAGLDGSYKREEFGQFLKLIPIADSYTKLTAWCMECSKDKKKTKAPFTHRKSMKGDLEETGGIDKYIPVCRGCYLELNSGKMK